MCDIRNAVLSFRFFILDLDRSTFNGQHKTIKQSSVKGFFTFSAIGTSVRFVSLLVTISCLLCVLSCINILMTSSVFGTKCRRNVLMLVVANTGSALASKSFVCCCCFFQSFYFQGNFQHEDKSTTLYVCTLTIGPSQKVTAFLFCFAF